MVIIGDAAHPVEYGIGASLAIEDGVVLARCIRDIPDVSVALSTYEKLRRSRIVRTTRAGRKATQAVLRSVHRRVDAKLLPLLLPHAWSLWRGWLFRYDTEWHRRLAADTAQPSWWRRL
jgi:2-polyprenyl-6-methoxyphenol hydroxylase-like FAD-dependent oxidoreductase